MGYREAMEAAGATVHSYQEFGSYQGDWWADVTVNGERGFVHGSYGSCSGCDAFQAEFSYSDNGKCATHRYDYSDNHPDCPSCDEAAREYQTKLAEFGKGYIDGNLMTREEAVKEATRYEWEDHSDLLAFFEAAK